MSLSTILKAEGGLLEKLKILIQNLNLKKQKKKRTINKTLYNTAIKIRISYLKEPIISCEFMINQQN